LLRTIVESGKRVLMAEAASVFLVDPASGELIFYTVSGSEQTALEEVRLAKGTGLVGWVAEKGEAVLVPDVAADPRWFKGADDTSSFKTRSIVAVPLKGRDRVIGVMEVLNKKEGTFDSSDQRLLQSLANQAAIACENAALYEELEQLMVDVVAALGAAIEARDRYTAGHVNRVMEYALAIASEMAMNDADLRDLRLSALLHDVGKIGVREDVLNKPGKLDASEWSEMQKHTLIGHDLLREIGRIQHLSRTVRAHHERFDGGGYPDGLTKEAIPLFSRIISVADTFDAMTSDRVYRQGLPDDKAYAEIMKCAGSQFDPNVVEAFRKAYEAKKVSSSASGGRAEPGHDAA